MSKVSQSAAQKHRKHLVRNGKRNPAEDRGQNPDFSTHVRKTPTKKDMQRKSEKSNALLKKAYA